MRVLYPGRIGIWSFSFCGGRKTGEPGEKPSEQGGEPTYDTGLELNPAHIIWWEANTLTTAPSLLPTKE